MSHLTTFFRSITSCRVIAIAIRRPFLDRSSQIASIDLAERPESAALARVASVNFICPPEEARRRIKRVEQLGFKEILIGSQFDAIEEIERVRDYLKS